MDENLRNSGTKLCQETYLQRELEITQELIHSQNKKNAEDSCFMFLE